MARETLNTPASDLVGDALGLLSNAGDHLLQIPGTDRACRAPRAWQVSPAARYVRLLDMVSVPVVTSYL